MLIDSHSKTLGVSSKLVTLLDRLGALLREDKELFGLVKQQVPGGKLCKMPLPMTAHWRWLLLALCWLLDDVSRLDQVRFALARRFEIVTKHGKTKAAKLPDKELRYIFFQLTNPVMLLALAVARDLGQLTLKPELDFLQKRGGMRLALLPEFMLLTALRRTAIERAVAELRGGLTDEEVAQGEQQLSRFRNDEASTAELLPVAMPPSASALRPAMVGVEADAGWAAECLACLATCVCSRFVAFV
jgi:hypothetical protein